MYITIENKINIMYKNILENYINLNKNKKIKPKNVHPKLF